MAVSNKTEGNCFLCGKPFFEPHVIWDNYNDSVRLCLHSKCATKLAVRLGREAINCEKIETPKEKPKEKKVVKPEKDPIKDIVRDLIKEMADDYDIFEDEVTDTAHFMHDLGLDSMSYIEVLAMLEKKFKITLPESELENLNTIDECTEIVRVYQKNC